MACNYHDYKHNVALNYYHLVVTPFSSFHFHFLLKRSSIIGTFSIWIESACIQKPRNVGSVAWYNYYPRFVFIINNKKLIWNSLAKILMGKWHEHTEHTVYRIYMSYFCILYMLYSRYDTMNHECTIRHTHFILTWDTWIGENEIEKVPKYTLHRSAQCTVHSLVWNPIIIIIMWKSFLFHFRRFICVVLCATVYKRLGIIFQPKKMLIAHGWISYHKFVMARIAIDLMHVGKVAWMSIQRINVPIWKQSTIRMMNILTSVSS